MANSFNSTKYVLNDTFVRFYNGLSLARTGNRSLENKFKDQTYATGQALNYRLEERYIGGEGATATPESRAQVVRPLTIDKQFHIMLDYSVMELTFNRARDEPYLEMVNAPRIKTLSNNVEKYIASNFQKQTYQAVGTPGTPIDFKTILDCDAYLTELAVPEDGKRYGGISPRTSANLSNDLYNSYNDTVNTGALIDGFVGHLSGFDLFKTNFFKRQNAGIGQSGGTPPDGFLLGGVVTNGPITSGNTISVGSLGQAPGSIVFREGDIVEIDDDSGVFMINKLTREPLSQRAQFVVTQDVISSDGSTATIPVNPEIIVSGQEQNISSSIPNGAQILLRKSHDVSVMYHSDAIVFAAPPMKELRGGVESETVYSDLYKLSMTYSLGADIKNFNQLDRIDIICGLAVNPQYAVRVCS